MSFLSSAKFGCTAIKLLGGCKIITIIELGFLDIKFWTKKGHFITQNASSYIAR
jgi:hypothetical protein